MAWLLQEQRVLASLEVAASRRDRRRGLLGRDGIDGALLLREVRSVHTFGMRFPIDVAFCDHDLVVVRVATLPRNRVALPVRGARHTLEAEAGSFARWGLCEGGCLEVSE